MKNKIRKGIILGGIFIAALLAYFIYSFNTMEKSNRIYSSMTGAELPLIFVESQCENLNPIHGYITEMEDRAERGEITVLPEDRNLKLIIREYDNTVASVDYEIRSLDLTHLLEKSTITDIDRTMENPVIDIPIQNLIKRDREYLLKIIINTGEKNIYYYTRVVWPKKDFSVDAVNLAKKFTLSSFDRKKAEDIVMYMETDSKSDNNNLANVDIHSSFKQICWGKTDMKLDGNIYTSIKEYSGVMAEVRLMYRTSLLNQKGNRELFYNEDDYIIRYDSERLYIMDFNRNTEEVFDCNTERFRKNRINLGILDDRSIGIQKSESGKYIAFKTEGGLLLYNGPGKKRKCSKVFSYFSYDDDGIRENLHENDIKILSVKDNGDINFLTYGYITRGVHEGNSGIVYYTYDNESNSVRENFFINIPDNFDSIKYNLEKLSYLSENGMFYYYYNGNIYSVDTHSLEILKIASDLNHGEFCSSYNGKVIAYENEGMGESQSSSIIMINLDNDKKNKIEDSGKYVRVLGFIGNDLAYGITDIDDSDNGDVIKDTPVNEIRIVSDDMNLKTQYLKDSYYFNNFNISAERIHFDIVYKDGDNYVKKSSDTIIPRESVENSINEDLKYTMDRSKEKIWYIDTGFSGKYSMEFRETGRVSYEKSAYIDFGIDTEKNDLELVKAYSLGEYRNEYIKIYDAYKDIYDRYGYIVDKDNNIIWNRADKCSAKSISNPEKYIEILMNHKDLYSIYRDKDYIILNLEGMDVNSTLYYLNRNFPVLADMGGYYGIIASYDQFNIKILNPKTGETSLMGRNDADSFFKERGNKFISGVDLRD